MKSPTAELDEDKPDRKVSDPKGTKINLINS